MAIRDTQQLSKTLGLTNISERALSFIWLYIAQADDYIYLFNIKANEHELITRLMHFLQQDFTLSNIIKKTILNFRISSDDLDWITKEKCHSKWIEWHIKNKLQINFPHSIQHSQNHIFTPSEFRTPVHLSGTSLDIAMIDFYLFFMDEKIYNASYEVNLIRINLNEHLKFKKNFEWINDKHAHEKIDIYLEIFRKHIKTPLPFSGYSAPHDYEEFIIWLDFFNSTAFEKLSINKDARNRWNQRVRREKEKHTKRQCNFNLPIDIFKKLSELAKKHDLDRIDIIEILIKYESEKDIYINEWLNRKPKNNNPSNEINH